MKYLCLVYTDERILGAMPDADFQAFSAEHVTVDEELRQSGHSIISEALQPAFTAMTVRVRNGKASTTDGPFAETKEQLTGFYLIEANDLNDAIRIAAKIPAARIGSVEVRALWDLRQDEPRARRA